MFSKGEYRGVGGKCQGTYSLLFFATNGRELFFGFGGLSLYVAISMFLPAPSPRTSGAMIRGLCGLIKSSAEMPDQVRRDGGVMGMGVL